MDGARLTRLLESVRCGETGVAEALAALRALPFAEVGDVAHVDAHRELRCGFPEVVFGPGKQPADLVAIANDIAARSGRVLLTRLDADQIAALREARGDIVVHARSRCATIGGPADPDAGAGDLLVISAGTADAPVAEEAVVTGRMTGSRVRAIHDVGVAGVHRLLAHRDRLASARAIVVVAGMEGALPSVVAGLVAVPVVACPTSVGYGASFGGVAPLLTMLNGCAAGVGVVNIDNGFGAGYLASMINRIGLEP